MSSKDRHRDADLILKLYDLRREEVMRKARNWFITGFNPNSVEDIMNTFMGEHSAYLRMVVSYWEMAASLVNNEALDEKIFNDANGEHVGVYAKIAPFLPELRERLNSPEAFKQLETLVQRMPGWEERTEMMRQRFKTIAEHLSSHQQAASTAA